MIQEDIYTFRIDAYTPETIPMARLAEYMAVLAEMFGEKGSVHFKELKEGSTKLLTRVEREAAPKVRLNVSNARSGDGGPEAIKAYKQANKMLRDDNAEASLELLGSNILEFPGRKVPIPPRLGPFNQLVERDGVLVRVGGKDKTAHATIEDADGSNWIFEVTREMAMALAHHLFEKPIRVTGTGRFVRNEEGEWECLALRGADFKVLNADSLLDVVGRIRNLPPGVWNFGDDPIADLKSLRNDEGDGVN
jgi:hypothetical protein